MHKITVASITLSGDLMPVRPVSIYCSQCKWYKHRHWSYKVGGGGPVHKRRPRCFGVCQFIYKMADGWGWRRGHCFSTEILTNNKNNKTSTKWETTAKERTLHHIHTVHLPFFSILIPRVLLPLFRFSFSLFFYWCTFWIKAKWTLVTSIKCESLNLRMFTSPVGVDSVAKK